MTPCIVPDHVWYIIALQCIHLVELFGSALLRIRLIDARAFNLASPFALLPVCTCTVTADVIVELRFEIQTRREAHHHTLRVDSATVCIVVVAAELLSSR